MLLVSGKEDSDSTHVAVHFQFSLIQNEGKEDVELPDELKDSLMLELLLLMA